MFSGDRPSRRLAVIMFTDLVGSTAQRQRLGELRADELREAVDEIQIDVVTTNGGTLVKHTGDGVMATFGSVTAALGSAAGIQIELARLNETLDEPMLLRIGVGAGEVTSDVGDFFGMPVVVAARLCDRCATGDVLVADLVRQLVEGDTSIDLRDPAEYDLKGIDGPQTAWRLHWEAASSVAELPGGLRRDTRFAFVGRDREVERLVERWDAVLTGEQHVALVDGPPGVGKTRLVAEFAEFARSHGATVLFGRNDESLGVPYAPFAEAFRQYIAAQPLWALARRLGAARGELVRLCPELADLIPLPEPVRSDAETERFRLFAAVGDWLSTAASVRPIVLVLDDLQWAAPETVQLARHIAQVTTPMPVLVLCTVRDSPTDPTLIATGGATDPVTALQLGADKLTRISLTEFDLDTTRAFLEGAAGHELGRDGALLAGLVHQQTGGNAFFCRELAFHLVETGALVQMDGRWRLVVPFETIGVPDGVRKTVTDRLGRLSESARRTLVLASVVGQRFDVGLVENVSDPPGADLLGTLEECVAAGLLEEVDVDRFQFTHAIVRSTLYDSIGSTRRVRIHRQIVASIERDLDADRPVRFSELAHHAAIGARDDDVARAIGYCRRAGDQAMAQLAYSDGERFYMSAVELADRWPNAIGAKERCELLTLLASGALRAGDPEVHDRFATAIGAAVELGDPRVLAHALLAGSRGAASAAGTVDVERVRLLRQVLDELPAADDPLRAKLLADLAIEIQYTGDAEAMFTLGDHALAMARRLGDDETLAFVLTQRVGAIRFAERLDEQLGDLVELIRLSQAIGDPHAEFLAVFRSVSVYLQLGDRAGFEHAVEQVRTLCPGLGQRDLERRWFRAEEEAAWLHGDLDAAESWLDRFWTTSAELGEQTQALASYTGQIAKVFTARGRPELAVPLYEKLAPYRKVEGFRAGLAVMLLESGVPERAREIYDELMDLGPENLSRNPAYLHTLGFLASLCADFGDRARAPSIETVLLPYRALWIESGSNTYGPAPHFLARLADLQGHDDRARELFAEADERCLEMGAPILRAWNQIAWATAALGWGEEALAAGLLDAATAVGDELGAAGVTLAAQRVRAGQIDAAARRPSSTAS
ncbi:MAG: AAA family ATPase [Ilumatobacteraceae bacterium]